MNRRLYALGLLIMAFTALPFEPPGARADDFKLTLRKQVETKAGAGTYHERLVDEQWDAAKTAVIICDVWDAHHCLNAVRRMEEFLPRLNAVVAEARRRGATIIHSPSDCMPAYSDHPARRRALDAPSAQQSLPDAALWCSKIPAEEQAAYPIDQSDGGEDDDPREHAAWAARLASEGRNPNLPWKRQSSQIVIDGTTDFISDRGDEVWNILEQRGIQNVILTGVHTNMCVLGRPFGLRQMVRGGRRVVLMRDMTDCMYNPARWPYVSHYTGNDLIVRHVERFICPTISSDQILGGREFRFAGDRRPTLAVVIAEDGYQTDRTLPEFALNHLGRDFRVTFIHGAADSKTEIPGLEALDRADGAIFSVRRRVLKPAQLAIVRRFVEAGKPVIGLRTASHAWALRDEGPPAGLAAWPDFDTAATGAKYLGHPLIEATAELSIVPAAEQHPILRGVPRQTRSRPGSLYQFGPLAPSATLLMSGIERAAAGATTTQPIAWAYHRADGGRSFYTSLGEPVDFQDPSFARLLKNAVTWCVGLTAPVDQAAPVESPRDELRHWTPRSIPEYLSTDDIAARVKAGESVWLRAVVRAPLDWRDRAASVEVRSFAKNVDAWWEGRRLSGAVEESGVITFSVPADVLQPGEANLLVLRIKSPQTGGGAKASLLAAAPQVTAGSAKLALAGRWQARIGEDESWSNMPLPAKFGAPTDIVYQLTK